MPSPNTVLITVTVAVLGLLITILGKVYNQGREMGVQEKTITVLENEVKALREKAHRLSSEVQRLMTIEDKYRH